MTSPKIFPLSSSSNELTTASSMAASSISSMLAVSSSKRQDTGGEGGQGDSGGGDGAVDVAVSTEGHEMVEEEEVDGLLEGPGSSRLFTLGVVRLVKPLFINLKMEAYLETLSRLELDSEEFS